MLKFLLLIAVIGFAVWLFRSKSRGRFGAPRAPKAPPADAQPMLVCAHCGVHLPQADALKDAEGRAFCSEGHRLAGPR
jgi:uncharacterized protein